MPLSLYQRERNIGYLVGLGTGNAYLALSSTQIQPDGTGLTEPSGNGYSRVNIYYDFNQGATYDDQDDTYSISNDQEIQLNEATGAWGTLTYFAICDRSTDGNILAYGTLGSPISPVANTIPVVRIGQLQISEVVQ